MVSNCVHMSSPGVISMVVINGGNQILKYLILQVTNLSFIISFRGS